MTILGRGIDGLPLATDSLVVGMDSVLDELPVGTLGNVLTVTGTGVDWANPIGFGGDLQAINNLNDVSNTQTAIDNLTIANTVTVNVLQLTDHGSNSLVWSIEEDSASPTNALTFDYNSIEQVRIDPTGVITAGGLILDGPILSLGGSDLELTPASGQDLLFNGLVWPDTDGVTGQVLITDGSGTLSFGTTGSGGPAFLDNVFRIQDEGDNSKEIAFEAFNLTTSTIRTITMPDQNIDLTPGTGSFATEAEGNLAATALQNVSEDISPQLGGPLDMNSFSIGDGSRELISFVEDPAAANQIEIENEAPGSGPILRSAGDDTNIDLNLSSKGTGTVNITGDVIVSGTVDGRDIAADGALLDTALQNVVEDTSPTLGGTLNVGAFDFANSNGIVIGLATGGEDSVNHVEISNAITGSGAVIRSAGADTNVDLELSGKGTGNVVLAGLSHPNTDGTNGQFLKTDGVGNLAFATAIGAVSSVFTRTGAVVAVAGDYTASEITNVAAGTIGAVTVQAAINELDTEKLANVFDDSTPALSGNLDVTGFGLVHSGEVVLSFASGGETGVNNVEVVNGIAGFGAIIRAVGSDTNIDLNLQAKGTGTVNLGSGGVKLNAPLDANGNTIAGRDVAADGILIDGALQRSDGTMIGDLTLAGPPSVDLHAATKAYVDSTVSGLDVKASVRAASTSNAEVSSFTYTASNDTETAGAAPWTGVTVGPAFDGVTLVNGDRVLIKDSTEQKGNGIFTYDSGANTLVRATDADNTPTNEVSGGMFTFVEEGTQSGSGWVMNSPSGAATLGTDNLAFVQFSDTTAPVSSVFGRTGAVVSVGGDYTASQITNVAAGSIAAVDVQAAINELDGDITSHVGSGGAAHADVLAAGASGFMTGADKTKLDLVEANADVTDTTNVTSAGALMLTGGNMTGLLSMTGTGADFIQITSTDAGTGQGPHIELFRDSASPTANDLLGSLSFFGETSTSTKVRYARIRSYIVDPTNGTEDGGFEIATRVNTSTASRMNIEAGVTIGGVADQGAGTLNVSTEIYRNAVSLTTLLAGKLSLTGGALSGLLSITSASTSLIQITSTDAEAIQGPDIELFRDSPSPAADDFLGSLSFYGESSTSTKRRYARLRAYIINPTNGTEDGGFEIATRVSGSTIARIKVESGLQIGEPSGGDQGIGTVNATAVYDDGVLLTGELSTDSSPQLGGTLDVQTHSITTSTTNGNINFDMNGTGDIIVTSTDSGGASGPNITLIRDSSSPLADDKVGAFEFFGEDSASVSVKYARIRAFIVDPTASNEDGLIDFSTPVAGSFGVRMVIEQGMIIGSPTGDDQGVGTINATGVYDDGVLLTANPNALDNVAEDTSPQLGGNLDVDGKSIVSVSDGDINIIPNGLGEVMITGAVQIIHTSIENDDHALELIVNAAGFGDAKAIDVDYITGAVAATEEEGIILINIDESLSTGGTIHAIEILTTTEGSAKMVAIDIGIGMDPIEHNSGIFGNADSILNKAVDVLTALSSGGAGNISVFVADNDTATIGDAAKFEELEIILDTGASGNGIAPTFEYSTGVGTWATFSPVDGTNGFRNTGIIAWDDADLSGWVVGTGSEFLIRITRTRNSLSVTPILDLVQISAVTLYSWDKDGFVIIAKLDVDNINIDGNTISVSGDDTNADLNLAGKGTGGVNVSGKLTVSAGDVEVATGNNYNVGATGSASSLTELIVTKTGLTDNVATAMVTVIVPNGAHSAVIEMLWNNRVSNDESARVATVLMVINRVDSTDTAATFSTATEQIATSGTETLTQAFTKSANTGGITEDQTFNIEVALDTSAGSTANSTVYAKLLNGNATGITMAAA